MSWFSVSSAVFPLFVILLIMPGTINTNNKDIITITPNNSAKVNPFWFVKLPPYYYQYITKYSKKKQLYKNFFRTSF